MNSVTKERTEHDDAWEKNQIKLAQKNPKCFAPLYEKYNKRIFLYVKKNIGLQAESEDITSKTFEKALENISKFKWQGIPMSAWLYRIARNLINDYYRKNKTRKKNDNSEEVIENAEDENSTDHLESMVRDEVQQEVLQAIGMLKEVDQYIVYYKFFEQLSNKKIADSLGMTETNVGTRLNRLKKELEKYLKREA